MQAADELVPTELPLPGSPDDDFLGGRIANLFATSPATAIGNLFAGSMALGIYQSSAPAQGLWLWLAGVAALMVVRLLLVRAYRRDPKRLDARTWARLTMVQTCLVGVLWGLGGIWLLSYGTPYEDALLGCLALGTIMGALSNVSYWPAHLVFHVPLLFFLGIGYALDPEPDTLFLALACWVICPFIAEMGRRLQGRFNFALRLAWDNQLLAQKYAQANQELAKLSRTDDLTHLANKRHLDETLSREWRRCTRTATPLSVLMLDIDHFKLFNDSYGHLAGDRCIQAVAATLLCCVREDCDFVARFGGEEFCVVMPGTDLTTATATAERIRRAVATLRHPHRGAELGILSVSIGVACSTLGRALGPENLIVEADQALYAAKAAGRDRVAVFET